MSRGGKVYLIVVYDISDVKLQSKLRNYFRRFLVHTQLSVFEGEVTPSQFKEIQIFCKELGLNKNESVVIYQLRDQTKVIRHLFGDTDREFNNVI